MALQLTWEPITLDLRVTWRIAHGASDQRFNALAFLSDGEYTGVGEGAGVPQWGETQAGIVAYLASVAGRLGDDPDLIDEILNLLPPGSQAAHAAIDIALHDLWGQRLGQPLYRLLGLNPNQTPQTSFTVAMDEPSVMAERAAGSGYPIIKVKLGSPDDEAIIAAIRRATVARLRADANAGWTREQAARLIPRLAQYGLEFIEQPLPKDDIEGLRWLRQQKPGLPIFADESVRASQEVIALAGAVDGVVVKLMKTGGIREAVRTIHTAHALGMQVMISCMVESSVAVTAAAHLAALCEYVDLDGPLLIKNDPFEGVRYEGATLQLPDAPGLGLTRKAQG
jgi:L-alanine-DL-glutamate epimerase-like enolase superfamily enzyme